MAKSCMAKLAKFVIWGVNFIMFCLGLALVGLGIWAKVDQNISKFFESIGLQDINNSITWISILVIILGIVLVIIGLCGCVGAWREMRLLLFIYGILLFVLIVVELAGSIALFVFGAKIEAILAPPLINIAMDVVGRTGDPGNDVFQDIQFQLRCCGVSSYLDYFNGSYYQTLNNSACPKLPLSCCQTYEGNQGSWSNPNTVNNVSCCLDSHWGTTGRYEQGCLRLVVSAVDSNIYWVAAIAIFVIVIQIILLLASTGLFCAIGEGSSADEANRRQIEMGVRRY